MPAVTAIVPGVEASCEAVTATSGNVWAAADPPPPLVAGFVTVTESLPGVANAAAGTEMVSDVPSAEAVPVNADDPKPFTCVVLLNPLPVKVIC